MMPNGETTVKAHGIAISVNETALGHFDKPNAEPPQAILLATPTKFTGAWKWDDLVDTLHSTLDMARIRAVEPKQLDQTELSVFLPATILATTWRPVTMGIDLAVVNKVVDKVALNQ